MSSTEDWALTKCVAWLPWPPDTRGHATTTVRKVVLQAIVYHADWSTGIARPSFATIARIASLTTRSVQDHIAALACAASVERHTVCRDLTCEDGYIHISFHGGRKAGLRGEPNQYRVAIGRIRAEASAHYEAYLAERRGEPAEEPPQEAASSGADAAKVRPQEAAPRPQEAGRRSREAASKYRLDQVSFFDLLTGREDLKPAIRNSESSTDRPLDSGAEKISAAAPTAEIPEPRPIDADWPKAAHAHQSVYRDAFDHDDEGRCRWCGNPWQEGHVCPAGNAPSLVYTREGRSSEI